MKWEKGQSGNPKGRPKETPEQREARLKYKDLREAWWLAFAEMGGVGKFVEWGDKNPTEFYRLMSRLLPIVTQGPGEDGEHKIKFEIVSFKDKQEGTDSTEEKG